MALTKAQLIDLNNSELTLDLDADTSITADTDDQIDIKIAGADDFRFTANTFTALSGSGVVIPDGGLTLGSTAVTSTAAELNLLDGVSGLVQADLTKLAALDVTATELNLIDGGATVGTTAVASGDGVITNDGGTMRVTNIDTFDTYLSATTKTLTNKSLTAPTITGTAVMASLDISGDIDVDGTTNLDAVDIDGAVNVAADLTIASTNKIIFNDASQFIQGASATVLDIAATDEIELTATLIDIVGNATVSGTLGVTGVLTIWQVHFKLMVQLHPLLEQQLQLLIIQTHYH